VFIVISSFRGRHPPWLSISTEAQTMMLKAKKIRHARFIDKKSFELKYL
jgi:hypothetical protein